MTGIGYSERDIEEGKDAMCASALLQTPSMTYLGYR